MRTSQPGASHPFKPYKELVAKLANICYNDPEEKVFYVQKHN